MSNPNRSSLPDHADSTSLTTTTAWIDLLESFGVLAAGGGIALFRWNWPVALGLLLASAGMLWLALYDRRRSAEANDAALRKAEYVYSSAQLANVAAATDLPTPAVKAFTKVPPDELLSRGQLWTLLAQEMGDARATEALPQVLRYAHIKAGPH